jgi:hypothetical protein
MTTINDGEKKYFAFIKVCRRNKKKKIEREKLLVGIL